jgi:hypothetical protein
LSFMRTIFPTAVARRIGGTGHLSEMARPGH